MEAALDDFHSETVDVPLAPCQDMRKKERELRILINHSISGAADIIDLMRRARPDLIVIATHERTDTPIRLSADRLLPEPSDTRTMSDEAYADWLLGVAVSERADLVLPYRRRDALAGFRGRFADQGVRLLTAADAAIMRLLEDKPTFLSRMEALGAPIIPFRLFLGIAGYEGLRSEGDIFPDHRGDLCVKPANGIYGAGFRILRDQLPAGSPLAALSSLELPVPAFRSLLSALPDPEPMMLMPYYTGLERSVDFACLDGRLLGTVARMKAGTSQRLYHDPEGERLADLITRDIGLSGVLNLQTIEDGTGTQRLLEVNSRAAGGVGMTGLTSVNLPGLLLDALDGSSPEGPARVDRPVKVGKREIFWEA
jgi:hypothetical protein